MPSWAVQRTFPGSANVHDDVRAERLGGLGLDEHPAERDVRALTVLALFATLQRKNDGLGERNAMVTT
jgi:hypothetical protein